MALLRIAAEEAIARLADFPTIVDARSESEHAQDRLPGAVNWPTLDDAERASIGAEYVQVSPFEARKRGAALAARNVARHIERHVLDKPRGWQPLVYCWRGGQRSGALATVLDGIGFRVHVLDGGYQAFRRAVVAALPGLVERLAFVVVCGPTGSGKSLLLRELASRGEPVLDLEAIAEHRGSVLGLVPGRTQPSQKAFETRLWQALRALDGTRPVLVESESAKVGNLRLPPVLVERMRASPCVWLEVPRDARVRLLLREYAHFVADTEAFCDRLDALRTLRGGEQVKAWQAAARDGRHAEVVDELLERHYDPIYRQSMQRNFAGLARPRVDVAWDGDPGSPERAAAAVAGAFAPTGDASPLSPCAGRR